MVLGKLRRAAKAAVKIAAKEVLERSGIDVSRPAPTPRPAPERSPSAEQALASSQAQNQTNRVRQQQPEPNSDLGQDLNTGAERQAASTAPVDAVEARASNEASDSVNSAASANNAAASVMSAFDAALEKRLARRDADTRQVGATGKKKRRKQSQVGASNEPVRTRTMARLLMSQQAWGRAITIYEALEEAQAESEAAFVDLALVAELQTARAALAEEEERVFEGPTLRQQGAYLELSLPEGKHSKIKILAILCFDRSALVDWGVTRDDSAFDGARFRFEPQTQGDYALVALDKKGRALWATPMFSNAA